MTLGRRAFMGAAAGLAAATMVKGKVLGANDRIGAAVVGLQGRGGGHLKAMAGIDGLEVVALCDVDAPILEMRAAQVEQSSGKKPKTYRDVRDLYADDAVDVVFLATPNHWHTLGAIWACQAGKDVYLEKPATHTVWEGRQLVTAAETLGRIVQVGTQRRSDPNWQQTVARLQSGVIGDIYMSRIAFFSRRESIGFAPDEPPPDGLDWTLWQGPAPDQPFSKAYVHYNWHWFWHYGNGELGNNGPHFFDIFQWALGKGLPTHIHSAGGRFGYNDRAETPNTQACSYKYADGTMLTLEIRGRYSNEEGGVRTGNLFYGPGGYVVNMDAYDTDGKEIPGAAPGGGDFTRQHFEAFLNAVRTRDAAAVPATARDGHIAAAHCHLGNIAYRLGRDLRFDPVQERFIGDDEANALLTRPYRPGFEVPQLA